MSDGERVVRGLMGAAALNDEFRAAWATFFDSTREKEQTMSGPQKFSKRPVMIEAWQVTDSNRGEVAAWCGGTPLGVDEGTLDARGVLSIETLEGTMWATEGDWVIQGVAGEYYPCKPDIFELTYEKVW